MLEIMITRRCLAPQYVAKEFLEADGFISSPPGTGWRFLNEVKKELKKELKG